MSYRMRAMIEVLPDGSLFSAWSMPYTYVSDFARVPDSVPRQEQLYQQYTEAKAKQREEMEERLSKEAEKAAQAEMKHKMKPKKHKIKPNQQMAGGATSADSEQQPTPESADELLQKAAELTRDAAARKKQERKHHKHVDAPNEPGKKAAGPKEVVDNGQHQAKVDDDELNSETCTIEGKQTQADYDERHHHAHSIDFDDGTSAHESISRSGVIDNSLERAHDEL
eukprot:1186942-Prorocentrum_minimum.AAC.2